MAGAGGSRRSRGGDTKRGDVAPLFYIFVALAVTIGLLPTALRPPPDNVNQSAEFSPDAPPDDQQESIIAALNRGSTGTAGDGEGAAVDNEDAVAAAVGAGPGAPAPPLRSCKKGVGNPPRQVESLYAAPCAPAWSGDNGCETYQGVTCTEIRIAINGTNAGGSDPCTDGKLPAEPPATGECDADRTFRVMMQYFNDNFQLYGRRIQFYVAQAGSTSETDVRAAAVQADQDYKVFAAGGLYAPGCQELANRKVIAFCAQLPRDEYLRWQPYLWSFHMDGTELTDFTSEYTCKRLVGQPASHAGDPLMHETKRKFGLVYFSSRDYAQNGVYAAKKLRECGAEVVDIAANPDNAEGQQALATVVTRFKVENVTTVIPMMDAVSQIALTNIAESNSYFPEWIANGSGANTANAIAQLMNQHQWANAFGITPFEAERPNDLHDCYRAYYSIDPGNTPNYTVCKALFYSYLQLVNAIQVAGPNLNPQTFAQGLYKTGMRFYDSPSWAVGGGYAPGTQTYIHNAALVWWSPTTQDPQYLNTTGAWLYEDNAKRYRIGKIPAVDRAFNPDQAIPTPLDAGEYGGP